MGQVRYPTYSQPTSGQCTWRGGMSLRLVGRLLQNSRRPCGPCGVASSLKDSDILEEAQLDSGDAWVTTGIGPRTLGLQDHNASLEGQLWIPWALESH